MKFTINPECNFQVGDFFTSNKIVYMVVDSREGVNPIKIIDMETGIAFNEYPDILSAVNKYKESRTMTKMFKGSKVELVLN